MGDAIADKEFAIIRDGNLRAAQSDAPVCWLAPSKVAEQIFEFLFEEDAD